MHLIPVALAYNFVDVDPQFASSTLHISGGLFSDFQTPIYTILGVLLFGALVVFLIGSHHK